MHVSIDDWAPDTVTEIKRADEEDVDALDLGDLVYLQSLSIAILSLSMGTNIV